MTAPHPAPRTADVPRDTARKAQLNLTQVAAAALAAVTAAVLGSRLGVTGTLAGAGAASVVTTVGTAVYQTSLERSRQGVRALAHRTHGPSVPREVSPDPPPTTDTPREPRRADRARWFATLRWGAMVAAAIGGFVLAIMVITGVEWANGETIGGNGKGTTLERLVTAPPPSSTAPRSTTPSAPPSSTTGSAAPSASATPSTTPPIAPPIVSVTDAPPGATGVEPSPTDSFGRPAPSPVSPAPPLIPPGLPGVGG